MGNKLLISILLIITIIKLETAYSQKYSTYFYNKQLLDTVIRNVYDFDSSSFFDEVKKTYKNREVKRDIEMLIKVNQFISNKDFNLSVQAIAKKYKTKVSLQDSGWISFYLQGGYLQTQVNYKLGQILIAAYSYHKYDIYVCSNGYLNYSYPYFFILPYIDYPISFMGHLLFTNQVKI